MFKFLILNYKPESFEIMIHCLLIASGFLPCMRFKPSLSLVSIKSILCILLAKPSSESHKIGDKVELTAKHLTLRFYIDL